MGRINLFTLHIIYEESATNHQKNLHPPHPKKKKKKKVKDKNKQLMEDEFLMINKEM